jgi:hypothetical protein
LVELSSWPIAADWKKTLLPLGQQTPNGELEPHFQILNPLSLIASERSTPVKSEPGALGSGTD